MLLSKTFVNQKNLFAFSRRFFSVKEYDLAVIGGGPGGKKLSFDI